ncbi:MAG: saccharopine dehydrogenase NADP-binding domain-containing protein [Acidobacteria bacterium]|nr:saccharopine dehydrogenase NADP-binding domain-containing protein [Acidobacteriota bacterium]
MSKVTVLGGAGAVGSVAVRTLVGIKPFDEIVVADANEAKAKAIAAQHGKGVSAARVDAGDGASIQKVVKGSTVVLNCVGPFYKYAPTVLGAVAGSGINYVDVCDDYDATQKLLAMNDEVKAAGVSALMGMGSSPGVANLISKVCADLLLDSTEAIDIYHAHGGEPEEGRAVIAHRIHSMVSDIPVFLDGRFQTVQLFEESGRALEEDAEFESIGTYNVYPYPHPETLTLPQHIPGLRRVTNLGLVLPAIYAELIKATVRSGIVSEEPLDVLGAPVVPIEFAISHILSERPRLTREAGLTQAMGCLKIVIRGTKDGKATVYTFSMSSVGRGMGEGTGIPAALGAVMMASGDVKGQGVLPPEACVDPLKFLGLASKTMQSGGGRLPISIRRTVEGGAEETIDAAAILSALPG